MTTSDGREIVLVSGRNGLKHILERHVPSYFQGSLHGGGRDSLFPYGTTVADVIDMAGEAVKKKGDAIPSHGWFSATLRHGKRVDVYMEQNRVKTIHPGADGDFGWDVEDIIRNWP